MRDINDQILLAIIVIVYIISLALVCSRKAVDVPENTPSEYEMRNNY